MSMFETATEAMHEWELPHELHEMNEWNEMHELEAFETHESAFELHEAHELEVQLAQELMEITTEEELEEFLGKLVRSVGRAASGFIRSPIGKALGGVLKGVAKVALPIAGKALGTFIAPGIGTAIGGKLGSMASKLLEAHELEQMSEAEAEFEAARRYVSWARAATRNAMAAPARANPNVVVRTAAVTAARRHAPALLRTQPAYQSPWRSRRPFSGGPAFAPASYNTQVFGGDGTPAQAGGFGGFGGSDEPSQSGRWVRRGSRIVLLDV